MRRGLKPGDRVAVPSIGIVGTVLRVDPRCGDGAPCPCCGRGVGVQPDGNPNASYGVAPAECLLLAPGSAVLAKCGAA